jgi:hypothetical protein
MIRKSPLPLALRERERGWVKIEKKGLDLNKKRNKIIK